MHLGRLVVRQPIFQLVLLPLDVSDLATQVTQLVGHHALKKLVSWLRALTWEMLLAEMDAF